MNILQILEDALNHVDHNKRTQAEIQLSEAANNHFKEFINLLIETVVNEEAKTEVRMLAGIGLKNQLTSKNIKTKISQHERWISLDEATKSKIKVLAIEGLSISDERVANSAAQLVAAIADIELPRNEWLDLIPKIIQNTKPENPINVKRASHLAIGYICESVDPNNEAILAQASGILIAIVQGVQSNEPSKSVRLAALTALYNSLEFIKFNFEKEGERNYIMQVVCEATQADDSELQASAFGCLARIMALYYKFMPLYMEKALYGLTVSGMQSEDEKVACMAIEFWSTICEEELEISYQRHEMGLDNIQVSDLTTFNFALVAIQDVLPTLLTLLTRQNEDIEDDDWSVAMAAGACLQLFSSNVGNYIVEPTLQFISANISSTEWRYKEAAVMAFGSILEGPDQDQLKVLIIQALDPILNLMSDDSLLVKETVAWCLGRISELVIDGIDSKLANVLQTLTKGLKDHPKIITNCCWTLINITEKLFDKEEAAILTNYYQVCIPVLVEISGRKDNDFNSRTSAFETLSTFVRFCSDDNMNIIHSLATEVLSRLETIIVHSDDANVQELQVNILSLLTNIIRRLSNEVLGAADNLMSLFLKLLQVQNESSLIEEDIFIAISATSSAIGENFMKYMDAFSPFLLKALQNTESASCSTAIGLVADLSQSLGVLILPYLESFMTIFGGNLNNDVRRELRPFITSAFGDIASSIGRHFLPYLEFVMNVCIQLSSLEPEDTSMESIDYFLNLKESILDCFVGVVGGFAEEPSLIFQYIPAIFGFLQMVSVDVNMSSTEGVCRSVTGLLGDIAAMYPGGEFRLVYGERWVLDIIKGTRGNASFDGRTKDAARWAREQQKRQVGM